MLKTLKLASYLAVGLAAVAVAAILAFGLKGDSEIRQFLDQPGILERLKSKIGDAQKEGDKVSPLVAQAKALALRLDPPPPPPPPPPPKPVTPPAPAPAVARQAPKPAPVIPTPVVQQSAKFNLLATVVYESAPEKSLALLQTSGSKQEWFRTGEKVGHQEIKHIRDGSVVFTQGGRNEQEIFVPVTPQVKSILKNEQASAAGRTGPSSIQGAIQPQQPAPKPPSPSVQVDDSGRVRVVRPTTPAAAQPRPSLESRVERVRSIPEPTVQEQKESIQSSITSIQEMMNLENPEMTPEEKKEEEEALKGLMEILNAENKRLEEEMKQQKAEQQPEKNGQQDQTNDAAAGAAEKASADPNKP